MDVIPSSAPSAIAQSPAATVTSGPCVAAIDTGKLARETALRVAVVTPIPTPYRDPFWNELSGVAGVDLTVFYCSRGKSDRPWRESFGNDFRSEFLPSWNLFQWRGPDASCFWNPGISRQLNEGRYDAIIVGGYNHPTMWAAMLFAVRHTIPFFLMCESHDRLRRSEWKRALKRPVLRWIVRHAAGFLPTGRLASEYLVAFGASPDAMTTLPNVPDVDRIAREVNRLRRIGDDAGPPEIAGRPVILFVGRLIQKKRAELVIRAFHEIDSPGDPALVIVGDGPLRPDLEGLVNQLGLRNRVHFAGFIQPDEVLRWYARASLFVLPSSETWGVAVVEALAAGLPVVVSDEVGCHVDAVASPELGTVVPARNLEALRQALISRLAGANSAADFRQAWGRLEPVFRYDSLAKALARRLQSAVS